MIGPEHSNLQLGVNLLYARAASKLIVTLNYNICVMETVLNKVIAWL